MGNVGSVIREYRREDLEAMFRLDEICFEAAFRFSRRTMRAFAEKRDSMVVLAERAEAVAGFVIVHLEECEGERCGYVVTLDVAPDERRRGLAGMLMAEAERRVLEAGVQEMALHVAEGNVGAIRFYEGRGYVLAGREVGFYTEAGVDGLVYAKVLEGKGEAAHVVE